MSLLSRRAARVPTPPPVRRFVLAEQAATRAALDEAVRGWAAMRGASGGHHAQLVEAHTRDGVPVTVTITLVVHPGEDGGPRPA